MLFNNPLSAEKADRIIQLLDVSPGDDVLDVGCGYGEFLIRVLEACGARGLGIDSDADAIAAARKNADGRVASSLLELRTADIRQVSLADGSFDLAICIGSTHAFGDGEAAYPNTIQNLLRLVRPGGQILIGDAYWKQQPAVEYLQIIGDPVGIYRDHAGNIFFAEEQGLIPLYAVVSNEDEWDHFEWSHRMRIEKEAVLSPDDPVMDKILGRSRNWRNGYLRWGRETMGFGLYLFLKPGGVTSDEW